MQLSDYVGVFVYFAFMAFVGVALVVVSYLCSVRVKPDKYDWTKPFECGLRTSGLVLDRYPVHFYIVGILFVIFDVETVFMVPWAVVGNDFRVSDNQLFWFYEMLVFLVVLLIGYVYLWARGVLNWGHEDSSNSERSQS